MINLERNDEYAEGVVPDEDVETCLKVLRTVRNQFLQPFGFDAHDALLLSHAHAVIHRLCELSNEDEKRRHAEANFAGDNHRDDSGSDSVAPSDRRV